MGIGQNSFISNEIEYSTPQILYDFINKQFDFTLDVCATKKNTKCAKFYTKEEDALVQDWLGNCWMNPPFNRNLSKFVKKAYFEYKKYGGIKACLIPVRSNTKWWAEVCSEAEIWFINGEVNFNEEPRGLWLPMCVLIFGTNKKRQFSVINYRGMRAVQGD